MKSSPDRTELESYVSQHLLQLREAAGVPLLLLQCMDSRYPSRTLETMDNMGFRGKYDQLILAGASLGVIHTPEWQTTFMEQLEFAMREHGVTQVLILDHRDCGAYKHFLDPPIYPDDPAKEKDAHIKICNLAIEAINSRFSLEAIHCLLLPIETIDELVTWP